MPDDFTPPDGAFGDNSDSSGNRGGKQFSGNKNFGSSKYTLTGETEEVRIQVGIPVTTKLGVENSFDVLKSGDMIQCSVEEKGDGTKTVTAVWIVE